MPGFLGRFFLFNPFRSLTVGGVVLYVVAQLWQLGAAAFDWSALTPSGLVAVNVLSAVIGVTGLRNALERAKTPATPDSSTPARSSP